MRIIHFHASASWRWAASRLVDRLDIWGAVRELGVKLPAGTGLTVRWNTRRGRRGTARCGRSSAAPGDLQVKVPTRFDFVLGRSTVQALGLSIPPDVASQATDWVP